MNGLPANETGLKVSPAGNGVAVSGTIPAGSKVDVFNTKGQRVASTTVAAPTTRLNMPVCVGGAYVVRAVVDGKSFAKKITIK